MKIIENNSTKHVFVKISCVSQIRPFVLHVFLIVHQFGLWNILLSPIDPTQRFFWRSSKQAFWRMHSPAKTPTELQICVCVCVSVCFFALPPIIMLQWKMTRLFHFRENFCWRNKPVSTEPVHQFHPKSLASDVAGEPELWKKCDKHFWSQAFWNGWHLEMNLTPWENWC